MKRLMVAMMAVALVPTLGSGQDKTKSGLVVSKSRGENPPPQVPNSIQIGGGVKSFSRNNWKVEIEVGTGNGNERGRPINDNQYSRWDDRIEHKVVRLERKVERLEEVIDYLLYVNEQGGRRHDDFLYRCSMSVCREQNSFFCDEVDYRTEVAIGADRLKLLDELKRRGSSYYTDSFKCGEF